MVSPRQTYMKWPLGNVKDWWDSESKEKFNEKSKCIVWQYGNYTVEQIGLKINGEYTQGENIADDGGLKAAYLAYSKFCLKQACFDLAKENQ